MGKIPLTLEDVFAERGKNLEITFIVSAMEVDKRVKRVVEGFGLTSWRHINPRSIRDKAYIVLKKSTEPLHFVEIANRIAAAGFDKKLVTTQAVHNELIRYEQFVLVGRGLYALKEWGYRKGTVADVIENLLRKKSPMTKQEIITGVLKQRRVKKGTISLNLQKSSQFVRVGRAVYALDESRNIVSCCANRIKTAYGFIWRYTEDVIDNETWKNVEFNDISIKASNKGRIKLPSGLITYGWKSPNGYLGTSAGMWSALGQLETKTVS
jgi:hypothetical protein